jgi:hypothetical protein
LFIVKNREDQMGKLQGVNTKAIAERLRAKLNDDSERFKDFEVYYAHGESSKPDVCQPTTYMGRRYGTDATLSKVDIVVTKGRNVILGIEIEESEVRPKIVLGDVFGIALADKMCIQGNSYSVKNITIIIAVTDDGEGSKSAKYKRLERHLDRYFKANPSKSLKKVRIIPCPISDLVRRIERLIRLEIGKHS